MYGPLKPGIPIQFSREASMRVAFIMAVVALFPGLYIPAPQANEEEAIKAVAVAENKTFYDRNADAWQALWLHDAKVTRTIVANGSYQTWTGWEKVSEPILNAIKQPRQNERVYSADNFIIRQNGSLASLEYVQRSTDPKDPTFKGESHRQMVLVKDAGQWKIASLTTHGVASFGDSPAAVENSVNSAGYAVLGSGKAKEAIEILKVNVALYPNSWNAYDSLGEAYMEAGQRDLAIKNYEKSVELNPKNTAGLEALKKLRQH
jgi:tetratricopeptide (TPR) repeat protein